MKWMHWAVLIQVAFFVGWAGIEEVRKVRSVDILLETEPVDPRDLLAGHYMTLNYRNLNVHGHPYVEGMTLWVYLEPKPDHGGVDGRVVWRATGQYETRRPKSRLSENGGWAKATIQRRGLDFGIDRYYFSEARQDELNGLRGGEFYVLARLSRDGTLRVEDLIFKK